MWLSSRNCFKILPFAVMQRVARVCQRQLSYLCYRTPRYPTACNVTLHDRLKRVSLLKHDVHTVGQDKIVIYKGKLGYLSFTYRKGRTLPATYSEFISLPYAQCFAAAENY